MCSMQAFHALHSNAKKGCLPPSVTGGNWKKLPVTTSCITVIIARCPWWKWVYLDASKWPVCLLPELSGDSGYFLEQVTVHHWHCLQLSGSSVARSVSNAPSSIMSIWVVFQRSRAGCVVLMELRSLSMLSTVGAIAPHKCSVMPIRV